MKKYKPRDLNENFYHIVNKAKILWQQICKENYAIDGDKGSCVCGAGIEINFIPPRCRKSKKLMIITAREVSFAQGSLNWEKRKDEVMDFLKNNEIDAIYNWGNLD